METLELETTQSLIDELTNRSSAIVVALVPKAAKSEDECRARVVGPSKEIRELTITINMHVLDALLGDPDD